jgi:hypothetical protein
MNDEPSVLDYVKALLRPWRGAPPRIPPLESSEVTEIDSLRSSDLIPTQPDQSIIDRTESQAKVQPAVRALIWPWRALIALGIALFAQLSLEPSPDRSWLLGVILYLLAAGWAFGRLPQRMGIGALSDTIAAILTIQNLTYCWGVSLLLSSHWEETASLP